MAASSARLLVATAIASASSALSAPPSEYSARAFALLDRLVTCDYTALTGTFPTEALWQSGNTLEALSTALLSVDEDVAPRRAVAWRAVLNESFAKTPVIVDNCFDDHQWWLLGWARAYEATKVVEYVQRAASVFDFIIANGWTPQFCGGGVNWCPVSGSNVPYKNAVTSELLLASAMALAPHEALVGKPAGFYAAWAAKVWAWLDASGMQNAQGLFNDGLQQSDCKNNGQTECKYATQSPISRPTALPHALPPSLTPPNLLGPWPTRPWAAPQQGPTTRASRSRASGASRPRRAATRRSSRRPCN
jgi:hypothetical protein